MVLDLEVVRDNYQAFARSLPDTRVFYAVKANPAPEVLDLLARLAPIEDDFGDIADPLPGAVEL